MAAAASSSDQQNPRVSFESQNDTSKTMVSKVYDAFINHRGPDVKHTLALLLYNYIHDGKCRAFLDSQEFEAGDSIPSTIRNAICSSSVQIAIFTKGYAHSAWCLEELVLMLQQTKALFIPVFYGVKPWELRHIENGVYADAFTKFKENGRYPDMLDQWKGALDSASKISGYDFNNYNHNHEYLCKELAEEEEIVNVGDNPIKGICHCTKKFCKDIATAVVKVVERTKPLPVAKSPVGLNVLVHDFDTQVFKTRKEKANIIGIFGMGGIGKTTLAKEFFNKRRSEYTAACFLFGVREASTKGKLHSLQRQLLKDLFSEDDKFQHIAEGYSRLSSRLRRCDPNSTFLIVLDDIDDEDQLNSLLARDRLACGSLVLVTTRDERVLKRAKINCRYKLQGMDLYNSTELFCQHAFGTSGTAIGYEELVRSFVEACGGLPLSLKVLGSHVSGGDKHYWQLELTKVRNKLPEEIREILKISFDALDGEEKQIFMDIACFFISKTEETPMRIWKASGWINAEHALETLKDKCLVTVNEGIDKDWEFGGVLGMHDHVRDLGREIADEQTSPSRLWHPKHLKSLEGKNFQNILNETSGQTLRCLHTVDADKSVYKNNSVDITYFLGNANDCAETKSSLLWLRLRVHPTWEQTTIIPSCLLWLRRRRGMKEQTTVIPSWFPVQNLQFFSISWGLFQKLWQSDRMIPFQLKTLRLEVGWLKEFPLSSLQMLSQLEELELEDETFYEPFRIEGRCFSESLRKLTKLTSLVLCKLTLIGELAFHKSGDAMSPMVSLHKIEIYNVKLLEKISVSAEHCPSLQSLILQDLRDLVEVNLSSSCYELRSCMKIKTISKLPDLQPPFQLKVLKLKLECSLQEFPCSSLRMLSHLEELEIQGDDKYISIEGGSFSDSLTKLTKLRSLVLRRLTLNGELAFHKSRDTVSPMGSLHKIEIYKVRLLEKISLSAEHCPSLQSLILQDLRDLVELDLSCSYYELRSCMKLKTISKLPDLQASSQLKVLKLDKCSLQEFPYTSLRMLTHLEQLELKGDSEYEHDHDENGHDYNEYEYDHVHDDFKSISIEGGSFSESIRKLTKLKSLVLCNLTLNGELAFHKNRDAESPMVSLQKIEIVNVKLLQKVSVSVGLQSLVLKDLDDLVEVDLSPNCCKLRSCKTLKTNSMLQVCSEEEEFLCLMRIEIRRCWKLHYIIGIENWERLNFLLIEGGNGGNGIAFRNCRECRQII